MISLLEAPTSTHVPAHRSPMDMSPSDISDEQLMEMVQDSDPDALACLYDRYATLVKNLVMRVLHNEAEADDMVQEIFMEVWNRAGSYSAQKGKALGWMITMTRRRAIDRLRRREAYGRAETRLEEHSRQFAPNAHTHVEEDMAHSEMREVLERTMASLPAVQRKAIELAYFKGMSQREIAAYTGIPLGTIKTRLELAMKKLTVALQGMRDLVSV